MGINRFVFLPLVVFWLFLTGLDVFSYGNISIYPQGWGGGQHSNDDDDDDDGGNGRRPTDDDDDDGGGGTGGGGNDDELPPCDDGDIDGWDFRTEINNKLAESQSSSSEYLYPTPIFFTSGDEKHMLICYYNYKSTQILDSTLYQVYLQKVDPTSGEIIADWGGFTGIDMEGKRLFESDVEVIILPEEIKNNNVRTSYAVVDDLVYLAFLVKVGDNYKIKVVRVDVDPVEGDTGLDVVTMDATNNVPVGRDSYPRISGVYNSGESLDVLVAFRGTPNEDNIERLYFNTLTGDHFEGNAPPNQLLFETPVSADTTAEESLVNYEVRAMDVALTKFLVTYSVTDGNNTSLYAILLSQNGNSYWGGDRLVSDRLSTEYNSFKTIEAVHGLAILFLGANNKLYIQGIGISGNFLRAGRGGESYPVAIDNNGTQDVRFDMANQDLEGDDIAKVFCSYVGVDGNGRERLLMGLFKLDFGATGQSNITPVWSEPLTIDGPYNIGDSNVYNTPKVTFFSGRATVLFNDDSQRLMSQAVTDGSSEGVKEWGDRGKTIADSAEGSGRSFFAIRGSKINNKPNFICVWHENRGDQTNDKKAIFGGMITRKGNYGGDLSRPGSPSAVYDDDNRVVRVSWTHSNPEPCLDGYRVYLDDGTLLGESTSTMFIHSNITELSQYRYKVSSFRREVESPKNSQRRQVRVPLFSSEITGSAISQDASAIELEFTHHTRKANNMVLEFTTLEPDPNDDSIWDVIYDGERVESYSFDLELLRLAGLLAQQYSFRVKVYEGNNESAYSNIVTVLIPEAEGPRADDSGDGEADGSEDNAEASLTPEVGSFVSDGFNSRSIRGAQCFTATATLQNIHNRTHFALLRFREGQLCNTGAGDLSSGMYGALAQVPAAAISSLDNRPLFIATVLDVMIGYEAIFGAAFAALSMLVLSLRSRTA